MRTVKASEFKAKCLQLMDEVAETGEAIVITKNGVPVARLEPMTRSPKALFGALKGTVSIKGDIVASADADWRTLP